MKKHGFIKIAALLLLCYSMVGCGKDNPSTPTTKYGSIYGTVTDFATGDPVNNANVRLNPRGETTLTGSDGTFQFNDVADGRYSLSLSKNGYVDLDDDYVIEITNGNSVRRDVQLYQKFKSFIVTVNGIEVDTLDFGSDPSFNRMGVLLSNNGTLNMHLYTEDFSSSSSWCKYDLPNYYYPIHFDVNEGWPIGIIIDRSKLPLGESIGYIYFNIETVSKTLVVKAKRI